MTDTKREIFFHSSSDPETGWLTNYYERKMIIDGKTYMSVEHYHQSQKGASVGVMEWIRLAPTPDYSKEVAHLLKPEDVVSDWEDRKVEVMRQALTAKFTQNPDLKAKLLATGDAVLHEDAPNDMFWGMKGKDMVGKLLMELREKLNLKVIQDHK